MDSNLGAICVSRLNVASTQNENFVMEHVLSKKSKNGKRRKNPPPKQQQKNPNPDIYFLNRLFTNYTQQHAMGLYSLIETVPFRHSRKIKLPSEHGGGVFSFCK